MEFVVDAEQLGAAGAAPAADAMEEEEAAAPEFAPLAAGQDGPSDREYRRLRVPPHRYTPLRENWETLLAPLVQHMKLQVRFNPKVRCVEMRTSPHTEDASSIQKGADFISAFLLGFEVQDAIALLRLDDLYVDSFQIQDVKTLHGDHLSRAIGRIAGQDGKTKFAIENATRTRIVLANTHVHILGSFQNIRIARDAICSLIMGAPPGKVYNHMRNVARRMKEQY
uniref:K Homology domain-containing protein n=1 Tax=Phaeomonas parva TaxID=124430 RepID=A0A7S1UGM3_9STRA|mmetsp:Transcript_46809/g.146094  ORF Transcript_46809/g.146094 Transcript_46809/m.146094 type:complete len:225 (+) Transcript_46809:225-899(+)